MRYVAGGNPRIYQPQAEKAVQGAKGHLWMENSWVLGEIMRRHRSVQRLVAVWFLAGLEIFASLG